MTILKCKTEVPKQLGLKKQMKNGVINVVFISPSWYIVLNLSKIVSFLQFFADIRKKSKADIAIYVHASESSCFALLENGIGYYAMIYSLEDISVWIWWILLNFCGVSTFLDTLFFNILWTVNISNLY